jgi:phospholipid transport system substrate-binding protein
MGFRKGVMAAAVAVLCWLEPATARGGAPTEQVRGTIEKLIAALQDPALKGGAKARERRDRMREIIYPRFDFPEMARRSLGPHWQRLNPEQRKEFVKSFTALLEGAYLDKIESYNGEKVRYVGERQDGDFAEVATRIVNKNQEEFAVNYRLQQSGGEWKVYDVVIENISLVNNYRSQFNRILARSSFQELLAAMNERRLAAPAGKGG